MTTTPAIRQGNLFNCDSPPAGEEHFETLLNGPGLRISRIASNEHASPEGFWYDQAGDEWVVVVRGAASIEFTGGTINRLASGDWLMIPALCQHRIASTGPDTVWIAVHSGAPD